MELLPQVRRENRGRLIRNARCTICGKRVDNSTCYTYHKIKRIPYVTPKKRWTERRGKTWVFCDECAGMVERWFDRMRGQ